MPETILIIEDDAGIRLSLKLALKHEGYSLVFAKEGAEGIELAHRADIDLVLLDVMLPERNGYEVLKEIRALWPERPVLMVTAKDHEDDRVRGLKLGADDYVVKPFSTAELLARVGAALRRTRLRKAKTEIVRIGAVTIDFDDQTARDQQGADLALTSLEFRLLRFLLTNEGRLVTRDRILHAVWGADYVGTTRTVDNFVARLRGKLDDDGTMFVSVRGEGYRFQRAPE
jgi:DNA-binding response OmpR family regulator